MTNLTFTEKPGRIVFPSSRAIKESSKYINNIYKKDFQNQESFTAITKYLMAICFLSRINENIWEKGEYFNTERFQDFFWRKLRKE